MSRDRKIILSIILGLLGVCLCCVCAGLVMSTVGLGQMTDYLEKNMNEDPQAVATAGAQLATFDLPEGYHPMMSTNIIGINMVSYQGPEPDSIIMLMQYPAYAGLSQEQMQEQMQMALRSQSFNFGPMTVVDQVETTIKDQPATLIISQAEDTQNGRMRQVVTTFEGNNGVVMLMIMGREGNWNQDAVDAFLASIR
jgi:hypothetical protein